MSSSSGSKTGSLSSAKSFYSPIITVRVGPDKQEFYIHKGVLCSNSNYFAKALSGQFQEAKTNTVELDDVHVLLFKVFVAWLYTGKLTYESSDPSVSAQDEFEKLDTMLNELYPFDREDDPESDMPMTDDLSEFDAEDPTTWTHTILCALFVLADRLDTPRLKSCRYTLLKRKHNEKLSITPTPGPHRCLYIIFWPVKLHMEPLAS
ncbi:hypothetical protein D6C79_06523 [Aureobasidium pullulans]|nr:hypothetical protein D6C79_06523 [Aureobasidium pullulans]